MQYNKMLVFPIILYILIKLIFIAGKHNMASGYMKKIETRAEQEQDTYPKQIILPYSNIHGKLSGLYEFSRDADRDGITDNIDREPFNNKKY